MDENAKATYINQSIANVPDDKDLLFFKRFRNTFDIVGEKSHPNHDFWKDHLKEIVEKTISFNITDYKQSTNCSLNILKKLCDGKSVHFEKEERAKVLAALLSRVELSRDSNIKTKAIQDIKSLQKTSSNIDDVEWAQRVGKIKLPAKAKTAPDIPMLDDALQRICDLWRSKEVYDLQKEYIETIFRLAGTWSSRYTEYKRNKSIVDFSDIEHYMYVLLQDKEVAKEIGLTYTHLFVDEFQDCSPVQVKIFMSLADVVKQSYWVGDTKQAIYGFRGSDTALTKAIADRITAHDGKDGCKVEKLKENWRSVPALVQTTSHAFVKIFEPFFQKEQVTLESAMQNHPEKFDTPLEKRSKVPLCYLNITESKTSRVTNLNMAALAQYIKNMLDADKGLNPRQIAVLGRKGKSIDTVQEELETLGIVCDRERALDTTSKACQLMLDLATLTVNPADDLTKAEIAYLTNDEMGVGKIIDSKLEYNAIPKEEREGYWLDNVPIIKKLNAIRDYIKNQGVKALIESLAIELDVKNVMERWPTPVDESMREVKALIGIAGQYEERSITMAQPATPTGLAKFLSQNDNKLPVTGNGVQLVTCHGAKGLEWKYVFLLMDENLDDKFMLQHGYYGIQHFHPDMPCAENLYPEMSIRFLPWIFGAKKNVPDCLSQILFASEDYENFKKQCIGESARLLYVGMTRAAEVLVLVPYYNKGKEFNWLKRVGLDRAGNIDDGKVLGTDEQFQIETAIYPQEESKPQSDTPRQYRIFPYQAAEPCCNNLRALSPSCAEGKADKVNVVCCSEQYIKVDSAKLKGRPYSDVGTCIHDIFAAIDGMTDEGERTLIEAHKMSEVLPYPEEIMRAWSSLTTYLHANYGIAVEEFHELPFRQLLDDGRLVVGSIDYVYKIEAGEVLVDFKTFPQVEPVTDINSPHYAGHYAGQLDTYQNALEADGNKVIARLIYYPVTGMVVEIGNSCAKDSAK